MPMSAERRRAMYKTNSEWDKRNMRFINLKLNKRTDADIVAMLDAQENKTGYVRQLIRNDIEARREDN